MPRSPLTVHHDPLSSGQGLAKASSRAGKTTCIDLYCINDCMVLADVPGYGFEHETSVLSKKWQRQWGPLCENYLSSTPPLRAALFLADVRWCVCVCVCVCMYAGVCLCATYLLLSRCFKELNTHTLSSHPKVR